MLTERDYVLRLVRELARVIARLLRLDAEGRQEQASLELEQAVPSLLGLDLRTLALLDPAAAAAVLASPARISAYAQLLRVRGELDHSRGEVAAAARHFSDALALCCEASRRGADRQELPFAELLARLPSESLDEATRRSLTAWGLLPALQP